MVSDAAKNTDKSERNTCREWEKGVVLEQNRDGLPKIVQLECADVVPANEYAALVGVIEPDYELEDRTLPRAIRTDDDLINGGLVIVVIEPLSYTHTQVARS